MCVCVIRREWMNREELACLRVAAEIPGGGGGGGGG